MTIYAFSSGHDPKTGTAQLGMTLRDYFAAQAMVALIHEFSTDSTIDNPDDRRRKVSEAAYKQSDEMMKARDE